jgi:ketosteroid isomerase-like protein
VTVETSQQPVNLEAIITAYLEAVDQRDLARCVAFYAADATISFMSNTFEGQAAIESWHVDRFNADMRLVRIHKIRAKGDSVTVEGSVASKPIKVWKLDSLRGKVTFKLRDDKIVESKFGLAAYNPFQGF